MEQKKNRHEILSDLVAQGLLTKDSAHSIEHAPKWSFTVRELVSYLAAVIIAVGVLRILAIAFQDASRGAIMAALYVVSAGTGYGSWKLLSGSTIRRRFAEVLELGSLGSFLGATAIVFIQVENLDGPWSGVIISALGATWGLYRCRQTVFAGTVALVIGIPAFSGLLGEVINNNIFSFAILTLVPGVILLILGTRAIGVPVVARVFGSLFYVIGSISLSNDFSNGQFIAVLFGAILFVVGSIRLAPEILVAGALLVVVGIVTLVNRWVNNDLAQGLVIIASGLAMLGVLSVQMKRAVSRPKTETPTV